jgi:hypothetical protein
MDKRMTKVSLYTRKASKYKLAKPQQVPLNDGQSYVLRYAGTWETLKDVRTYVDAMTAATAKRLEFLSGKQQAIKAERKPKSDVAKPLYGLTPCTEGSNPHLSASPFD